MEGTFFADVKKNREKINRFLKACRNQHKKECDTSFRNTYRESLAKAEKFFSRFKNEVEQVPFEFAIEHWLGVHAPAVGLDDACDVFEILVSEKVIRLEDDSGKVLTLGDQAILGHVRYIEAIRCLQTIPLIKRERMVNIYLQFSKHLSQATLGFIPAQEDPDRMKVENKAVPYDEFMDFIHHLSERDALMAFLMYFDEPSMTEVIDLKLSQVDFIQGIVTFGKRQAIYPTHVMQRLHRFVVGKNTDDLVFQNRNHEAVNRSRIYRAFKNASSKMTPSQELTPKRLCKKHH
ncbi:MAG: hypothetical protein WB791_02940 [Waddliaceae bacterium]